MNFQKMTIDEIENFIIDLQDELQDAETGEELDSINTLINNAQIALATRQQVFRLADN